MSNADATSGSSSKRGRWFRVMFRLGLISQVIFLLLGLWYINWKSSGTGQWELYKDSEGVVVHTKKNPGDPLVMVRGVGRLESSLAGIFKLMREAESCIDAGCYNASILETVDYPHIVYYEFTYPIFFPFKDREYIVVSEFSQDPETLEIRVDYRATPEKVAPNDCCVRITRMDNQWRFTPLENGEIETEFVLETSSGGFFPDFVISMTAPRLVHWAILDFQRILDQEKYRSAPADYIIEPENNPRVLSR